MRAQDPTMNHFTSPYLANEQDVALDVPMTFVTCNGQKDLHVFIPDTFDLEFAKEIATNFRFETSLWNSSSLTCSSRKIQQPVKGFLDVQNHKIRLCPMPATATIDTATFGRMMFTCG